MPYESGNLVDQVSGVVLAPSSNVTYVMDGKANAKSAVYLNSQYLTFPPGVYFRDAFTVVVWLYQLMYGKAPR